MKFLFSCSEKKSFNLLVKSAFVISVILINWQAGFAGILDGEKKIGVSYSRFDESELTQITGNFSIERRFDFADKFDPFSGLSLFNLTFGSRFYGDSSDVRRRVKLVDVEIINNSLVIGGTVLDYNQADIMEDLTRWVSGRLGFSLIAGNQTFSTGLSITGFAAQSEWKMGKLNYGTMGTYVSDSIPGLETGYRGKLSLNLGTGLQFLLNFSKTTLLEFPDPILTTINGKLLLKIGNSRDLTPELFLGFTNEKLKYEMNTVTYSQKNNVIKAGIGLMFGGKN